VRRATHHGRSATRRVGYGWYGLRGFQPDYPRRACVWKYGLLFCNSYTLWAAAGALTLRSALKDTLSPVDCKPAVEPASILLLPGLRLRGFLLARAPIHVAWPVYVYGQTDR